MVTSRIKVVFFGNEKIATGVKTENFTLKALIKADFEVCAIIVNQKDSKSRSSNELNTKLIAEEHNIPFFSPKNPIEIIKILKSFKADVGVLVAYGRIIPQEIIDIFPFGIINLHPSILPKHRGPTPIESSIIDNDRQTGVSIISLSKGMDEGPVYGQSIVNLKGSESKQYLTNMLSEIGSKMIVEFLPRIISKAILAKPQDNSRATYDKLINKSDGQIDWNKPAVVLERQIRAYLEWPRSYTTLGGIDLIIKKATVLSESGSAGSYKTDKNYLLIFCGKDALNLEIVQPIGKKEMPIKAFLAGYRL